MFYFVQSLDPCEDIASFVTFLFLNLFVLDATNNILDLCDHLEGTLVFERRWVSVIKEVLKQ